jgi:hypothetical protein
VTHIITSRVDNDDALGATFLRAVQNEFRAQDGEFINFDLGFQMCKNKTYRASHSSNPFCSLIEAKKNYCGVFCAAHTDIADVYPVRHVVDRRRWLTIVHDRNAMNRIDGSRCKSSELEQEFRFLRIATMNDFRLSVAFDRASHSVRSAVRAARKLFTTRVTRRAR